MKEWRLIPSFQKARTGEQALRIDRKKLLKKSYNNMMRELGFYDFPEVNPKDDCDIVFLYQAVEDPTRMAYLNIEKCLKWHESDLHHLLVLHLNKVVKHFDNPTQKSKGTFGKVGKTLNRCFTDYPQEWIEKIASRLQGQKLKTEFVKSGEIGETYQLETADNSGTLGSSCMRPEYNGDIEKDWFEVYDDCAHGLEIERQGDKLKGRALVWKVQFMDEERLFLDRIYGTEAFIEKLESTYDQAGHLVRTGNGHDWSGFKDCRSGEEYNKYDRDLRVSCHGEYHYAPYMDSFKHFNGCELITSTSGDLIETDGTGFRSRNECCCCNGTFDDDEITRDLDGDLICFECGTYVIDRDGYVYRDNAIYIRSEGEFYHEDSLDIVEVEGEWYLKSDDEVTYDEIAEEYIMTEESVYCEHDDLYTHIDNAVYCDLSETYELNDNVTDLVDGSWIHNDYGTIECFEGEYYLIGHHDEELNEAKLQQGVDIAC